MKKYVAFVVLFLLIAIPVIGYVESQRDRILKEHLKHVAELAVFIEKNSKMDPAEQAQLRYLVQALRSEASQYEQAIQSGR